jgi:hypothetical protein
MIFLFGIIIVIFVSVVWIAIAAATTKSFSGIPERHFSNDESAVASFFWVVWKYYLCQFKHIFPISIF